MIKLFKSLFKNIEVNAPKSILTELEQHEYSLKYLLQVNPTEYGISVNFLVDKLRERIEELKAGEIKSAQHYLKVIEGIWLDE